MGCGQGFKFFDRSYSDIQRLVNGSISVTLDDNLSDVKLMLDRNNNTFWESLSSASDATPVTFTVTFEKQKQIDSLFLFGTNLKSFTFDYFDSGWNNIITETLNEDPYYQNTFSPITTDQIRLVMNGTITPNEEKKISQFIVTNLIGQLEYRPPAIAGHKGNILEQKMIDGRSKFLQNKVQHIFNLKFSNYTSALDRQLILTLGETRDAILFWPSGGDSSQFIFNDESYRIQDIFLVARSNFPSANYTENYYRAGTNQSLTLKEVS